MSIHSALATIIKAYAVIGAVLISIMMLTALMPTQHPLETGAIHASADDPLKDGAIQREYPAAKGWQIDSVVAGVGNSLVVMKRYETTTDRMALYVFMLKWMVILGGLIGGASIVVFVATYACDRIQQRGRMTGASPSAPQGPSL